MEGALELPPDPPHHSHGFNAMMWTNKEVLSPIWRELPVELVQMIFHHLIEIYIDDCFFNDECELDADGKVVARSPSFGSIAAASSFMTWNLRREPLFRRQRHLIERHFQDEWLTRMTLYLFLDSEANLKHPILSFVRYFHFPDHKDHHAMAKVGPDQKVTFFLYKPEQFVYVAEDIMPLEGLEEELVDTWDDYVGDRTSSYLIVGVRARTWQQNVTYMPFYQALDMYNLRKGSVDLEGLEVSEDGRYIRFRWEDFITGMVNRFLHDSMKKSMDG